MKYLFSAEDSLVKEINIVSKGKELHATLHAPEGGDPASLSHLKCKMEENGFSVFADVQDDNHVLNIRGFNNADKFMGAVANDGGVSGPFTVEITPDEMHDKKNLGDMLHDNALTVAGWLYLAADSCIIGSAAWRLSADNAMMDSSILQSAAGAVEPSKDFSELGQGIMWWIPSFFLILAGHQDPKVAEGFLKRDMLEEIDRQNLHVPTEVMEILREDASDGSLVEKLMQAVYDHGPAMNNVMQMIGGALMLKAGHGQENFGKMLAGALVLFGMGAGLFLPEHEEAKVYSKNLGEATLSNPEQLQNSNLPISKGSKDTLDEAESLSQTLTPKEDKGFLGNLLRKIDPLAYSGTTATGNNILNGFGVWDEKSQWYKGEQWHGGDKAVLNPLSRGKGVLSRETLSNEIGELKNDVLTQQDVLSTAKNAVRQQQGLPDVIDTDVQRQQLENALKLDHEYQYQSAELEKIETTYQEKALLYGEKNASAEASTANGIAQILYIAANHFYAQSSKENTADLKEIDGVNGMMALMANIVVAQPAHEQNAVIERLATKLSESKYIDSSVQDVSDVLHAKVEILNQSVWLGKGENNIAAFSRPEDMAPVATVSVTQNNTPDSQILEAQRESLQKLFSPQMDKNAANDKDASPESQSFEERIAVKNAPEMSMAIH